MFTGLLFYAHVEIHQVRILVFDNYQSGPVPLSVPTINLSILWMLTHGFTVRTTPTPFSIIELNFKLKGLCDQIQMVRP